MSIYIAFILFLLIVNYLLLNLYLKNFEVLKNKFISNQLLYFFIKILSFSSLTIFFCFFSPLNRLKFILLSLSVFLIIHFTEAFIFQTRLERKK